MSYSNLDKDASILAENIIKIGKKCTDYWHFYSKLSQNKLGKTQYRSLK